MASTATKKWNIRLNSGDDRSINIAEGHIFVLTIQDINGNPPRDVASPSSITEARWLVDLNC